MEMTRREFVQAVGGAASVLCAAGGRGGFVSRASGPRLEGETPSTRGTLAPRSLGEYPGQVVPVGEIDKLSKWSG